MSHRARAVASRIVPTFPGEFAQVFLHNKKASFRGGLKPVGGTLRGDSVGTTAGPDRVGRAFDGRAYGMEREIVLSREPSHTLWFPHSWAQRPGMPETVHGLSVLLCFFGMIFRLALPLAGESCSLPGFSTRNYTFWT